MPLDQTSMRRLLGYNLALATIHADGAFEACIGGPLQLRRAEFTILSLVGHNEDVTARTLSITLKMSAPHVSALLDRLAKRGLLKREPHGTDGRSMVLVLTAKGRSLLARAERVAQDMEAPVLARLTVAERAMLVELLQKVGPAAK